MGKARNVTFLAREGRHAVSRGRQQQRVISHEQAFEVLTAVVGVPVVRLRHSALGETRRVKERPRTRPSGLRAGGSATATLWNDRSTAI